MFARAVHILLIAALLGCPLCCQFQQHTQAVGVDAAPASAAGEACCDSCHRREAPAKSQQAPAAPDSDRPCPCKGPCQTCQCICGGAIMPNADEDGAAQLKRTLDQLAVTAAVIAEVPARTESPTDSPHQKWKATPGRALCALYMTRLC